MLLRNPGGLLPLPRGKRVAIIGPNGNVSDVYQGQYHGANCPGNGGDHYDWHVDIGHEVNGSRKLSFTLQLSASSDYDGGDLEFLNASYE